MDPAAQAAHPTDQNKRQEADEAVSRPSGSASKHRSAAAMAMIMALEGHPNTDWEAMVKTAWWGCLCGRGFLFKLTKTPDSQPIVFMSLGVVSYAILGWPLQYVQGQAYIRMADNGGQRLQWFFGHDIQKAHAFKGITVEQLVQKPQIINMFGSVCLCLCVHVFQQTRLANNPKPNTQAGHAA